jgi:thymidylate synthase (FAD)
MKIIDGGDGNRFEIIGISVPIRMLDKDTVLLDEDLAMVDENFGEEIGLKGLQNIEIAGRTCYRSEERITSSSAKKFVKMLKDAGHHAMLEHSSLTVKFFNTSRGFTHELVRHRLCAFGQESTRYVDESKFQFVLPPQIEKENLKTIQITLPFDDGTEKELFISLEKYLKLNKEVYLQLMNTYKWKKQDARQFLPIGITNDIVLTANFREWMHIFKMRTSIKAHWEIRCIMIALLEQLQKLIPIIFDDFEIQNSKNSYGIRHAIYKGK